MMRYTFPVSVIVTLYIGVVSGSTLSIVDLCVFISGFLPPFGDLMVWMLLGSGGVHPIVLFVGDGKTADPRMDPRPVAWVRYAPVLMGQSA
jgi:hypothetical protein